MASSSIPNRQGRQTSIYVLVAVALCAALDLLAFQTREISASAPAASPSKAAKPGPSASYHPVGVVIDTPLRLKGMVVEEPGGPVAIRCNTCHTGPQKPLPKAHNHAVKLPLPHGEIGLSHGDIRCSSCHEPKNREQLRLADGRTVPLVGAMDLCRQCHGPQYRDYRHGSHGGFRGYWDATKGVQRRNHCVSCHDPHRPRFRGGMPQPKARDGVAKSSHRRTGQ